MFIIYRSFVLLEQPRRAEENENPEERKFRSHRLFCSFLVWCTQGLRCFYLIYRFEVGMVETVAIVGAYTTNSIY